MQKSWNPATKWLTIIIFLPLKIEKNLKHLYAFISSVVLQDIFDISILSKTEKKDKEEELSLKLIVFSITGSSQLWTRHKKFVKLWIAVVVATGDGFWGHFPVLLHKSNGPPIWAPHLPHNHRVFSARLDIMFKGWELTISHAIEVVMTTSREASHQVFFIWVSSLCPALQLFFSFEGNINHKPIRLMRFTNCTKADGFCNRRRGGRLWC